MPEDKTVNELKKAMLRQLPIHILLLQMLTGAALAVEPVVEKPIYNPQTKSYFELVPFRANTTTVTLDGFMLWNTANKEAQQRIYKGTPGRLAVVNSEAVRQFLLYNFRTPETTFIGLRYFCDERALRWVDGSTVKAGDYTAFDLRWNQGQMGCRGTSIQRPILNAVFSSTKEGFKWRLHGDSEGFA